MIVVPKAVLQNWVREFKDLFPNTEINVLGNFGKRYIKDPDNIKIKDGAVNFVTYEGMKRIGYKSETLDDLTKDVKDVMSAGGFESKELTARQKQKRKEKGEEFVGKAQKGAGLLMEDLNFDHITIDEAHNMKNVFERAGSSGKKDSQRVSLYQRSLKRAGRKSLFTFSVHSEKQRRPQRHFTYSNTLYE